MAVGSFCCAVLWLVRRLVELSGCVDEPQPATRIFLGGGSRVWVREDDSVESVEYV